MQRVRLTMPLGAYFVSAGSERIFSAPGIDERLFIHEAKLTAGWISYLDLRQRIFRFFARAHPLTNLLTLSLTVRGF